MTPGVERALETLAAATRYSNDQPSLAKAQESVAALATLRAEIERLEREQGELNEAGLEMTGQAMKAEARVAELEAALEGIRDANLTMYGPEMRQGENAWFRNRARAALERK